MEDQNQPKISTPEVILLVMFALAADALNWIPIINWFVSIVSLMGFQFYFFMKGVKKASKWSLAGNLFEFLPFFSILPAVTAGVVATIISDRISETRLGSMALGGKDALSELNSKQNRTREENIRLVKARQIMERGSIDVNETDPVLRAAYERAQRGEKVYDGTYANRDGFRFDNVRYGGGDQQDFRAQRLKALYELHGRERELELGRIRKQEAGELSGRALYSRGARREEEEQERSKKEAEKRAQRKYRPGWESEALAKEEKERQKIEGKK